MKLIKTLVTLTAVAALALPLAARADNHMGNGMKSQGQGSQMSGGQMQGNMQGGQMAGQDMGAMHRAMVDIVEVNVQKPNVIEVNTGREMKMADGQRHMYYKTHEAKDGNTLLDVRMQMVATGADEHAMFDPRSVQLVDRDKKDATPVMPFARFMGQDWMKLDESSIPVDYKAGMQFAFEVQQDMLKRMNLHVNGKDMGPVTALIDSSQEMEEAGS